MFSRTRATSYLTPLPTGQPMGLIIPRSAVRVRLQPPQQAPHSQRVAGLFSAPKWALPISGIAQNWPRNAKHGSRREAGILRWLALLVALSIAPLSAQDWTPKDTAWEAAYQVTLVADWAQTRYISRHSHCWENNPMLGHRPSTSQVDLYFLSSAVMHVAVSYCLPPKPRRIFQGATIGLELACIGKNVKAGIKIKW